ncbi:hypothetical protein FAGKG844_10136 [Frankia sp. AgKG'84/4]
MSCHVDVAEQTGAHVPLTRRQWDEYPAAWFERYARPRWAADEPYWGMWCVPEQARRRTPDNVSCALADVLLDPLPGADYDAIVSISALYHLPLPDTLTLLSAACDPAVSSPRCRSCTALLERCVRKRGVPDIPGPGGPEGRRGADRRGLTGGFHCPVRGPVRPGDALHAAGGS